MAFNGGLIGSNGNFNGIWLVVSTYPSEKYEFVSWDDEIPNIWENKTCSKPPTRIYGLIWKSLHNNCEAQLMKNMKTIC